MAPPKVRADYEQLKAVAGRLGSQAQSARRSLQALQRQVDVLQGGDWIGQGAAAFYREMADQVMPSLKRMAAALEAAQQTTLQISQVMAQAEAAAAQVLRGDNVRWDIGPGATAGPALAGPAAGSAGPAAPSGAATPQEFGASLRKNIDATRAAFGDQAAAALAAGMVQGLGGALPSFQAAAVDALKAGAPPEIKTAVDKALDGAPAIKAGVLRGHQDAAIDNELAPFSPGVRDLAKQSPTLRAEILQAQDNHLTFATGASSVTNVPGHTITIGQFNTDAEALQQIAHEMGHATSTRPDVILPQTGEDRATFVGKNVANQLMDEGAAQFNGAQVRSELLAAGGPDIGIGTSAHVPSDYLQPFNDAHSGAITQEQAVTRMAVLMANEPISQPPYPTHRDAYTQRFGDYWDTRIAPFLPP